MFVSGHCRTTLRIEHTAEMNQTRLTNLLFGLLLFGCNQDETSGEGQNPKNLPGENIRPESKDRVTSPGYNETYHTKYEYTDSNGKSLIIQNSGPRGELYTDPNGNEYAKAIFWTRIINETDNPLEWTIDFSREPYQFPGSVGSSVLCSYKIVVPPDTITVDRERLPNYWLDSFLKNSIHNPSSFKRMIRPKESSAFYVIRLLIKPESGWRIGKDDGNGTTRAGFRLEGQNIIYRLNGKEIHCGRINLKNLVLKNQLTTGL